MSVRLRASAIVVVVAAAALATAWAFASALQPATHRFVKGEHFRYSSVVGLRLGEDDSVFANDGPNDVAPLEEVDVIDVVDVSASGATLAKRVEADRSEVGKASNGSIWRRATIRASREGAWRTTDGEIVENFVTWDPMHYGAQPSTLSAGQRWQVALPRIASYPPSHGVVRVVSLGPDNLTLHVESAPVRRDGHLNHHLSWWYADVVFDHGIVRELHRVDMQHSDGDPGTRAAARFDHRIRLVSHTAP